MYQVLSRLIVCSFFFFYTATKLNEKVKDSNDIWDADEINDGAQYDDVYDTRLAPEYVII